jgi:hypothetical protein
VCDVQLPVWALGDSSEFIRKNREVRDKRTDIDGIDGKGGIVDIPHSAVSVQYSLVYCMLSGVTQYLHCIHYLSLSVFTMHTAHQTLDTTHVETRGNSI